jgi:hypothetical protein
MTQVSNYDMRNLDARLSLGFAGHKLGAGEVFLKDGDSAYFSSDVSLAWLPEHTTTGFFVGPAITGRFDFGRNNRIFGAGIGGRIGLKPDDGRGYGFAIDLLYEYLDGMYKYAPYYGDPEAEPNFKMHQNRSQGWASRISADYWFNPNIALGIFLDICGHWGIGDSSLDTTGFKLGAAVTWDILGLTRK